MMDCQQQSKQHFLWEIQYSTQSKIKRNIAASFDAHFRTDAHNNLVNGSITQRLIYINIYHNTAAASMMGYTEVSITTNEDSSSHQNASLNNNSINTSISTSKV